MKRTLKWGFFRKAAEVLMSSRFFVSIRQLSERYKFTFLPRKTILLPKFPVFMAQRKNLRDSLNKHKF